MSLPINFRNILNLFNIKDRREYSKSSYSIDDNVSIFFNAVDGRFYGDGRISMAELQKFLDLADFPEYVAEEMFFFDLDKDDNLSSDEVKNMFEIFDADDSNSLEWSEGLGFYNFLSDVNIPDSTTFTQYSNFLSISRATIRTYDTQDDDGDYDYKLDLNEYEEILKKTAGVDDGGALASSIINLYDLDGDNAISFEEMLLKNIQWDSNQNGVIEYDKGEARELNNTLPWYLKPQSGMTEIERMISTLVLYNDKDGNKELDEDEFKDYMMSKCFLPEDMLEQMLDLYSGGDNSFTFNELVSAYESFAGNDDKLSYEELIAFQNSISNITIDPDEVTEEQYSGLYSLGAQYIKSYDGDGDAEIDVKEYRAALKQAKDAYIAAGQEVPENIGEHMAENFVRLFDMDKNGKVSVIEIINQYSIYDSNKDGQVSGGEFIDLQERMEDSRLWDNVNEEFIDEGDTDFDKALDLTEFQNVLALKGLPEYIADDAFALFDLNLDDKLSRLEFMEAFSRYDNSAVNYAYIESLSDGGTTSSSSSSTGTPYVLYTGNANQVLDADEKLAMFEDLAALDAAGINYAPEPERADRYEKILNSSEELINDYDSYSDGVLSPDEYKEYFKDKGLPNYLADAIISAYDLSGDGNLDLLENTQMLLDYDANQNGKLDFHEEFKIYDDLTGIGLNINNQNKLQFSGIYDYVKDFILTYDINDNQALNRDGTLQVGELEKYFKSKDLPEDYANLTLGLYDNNNDGGLDVLEWMKAQADFDSDGDGVLRGDEELAFFDHIAGTNLPGITDSERYDNLETTIDSLIQEFDFSNNDKKLERIELAEMLKDLGLPDYIADGMLDRPARGGLDLNRDGGIDKMEWLKAYTDFDHNENGILDFNEELELYTSFTPASFSTVTADDIEQYSSMYDYLKDFFADNDDTTDRILTSDELTDYFTDLGLPAYMASNAITEYDLNGDGGLDIYEWLHPHIQFDVNKNGVLDFNEQMGMNAIITNPNLPIDPVTMNEKQVTNLYDEAQDFIYYYDIDNDKTISETEYIEYMKTLGLSDNVAMGIMATQDTNTDGELDLMELLNINLKFDINNNGIMDFNETMDLYQQATGIAFNTTQSDIYRHNALHDHAIYDVAYMDTTNDKKVSADEFENYYKDDWGITEDMANQIISHYDLDGDGYMDTLEFTKSLIDLDVNENGVWDDDEFMNFIDNGVSHVDLGGVNSDNLTRYLDLYNYAINDVYYLDTTNDKKVSADEFENYYKDDWGITEDMANQIISHYDLDGDGYMDTLEFTKSLIDLDVNENGVWDDDEFMNFIDNGVSHVDLGGVTSDNLTQYLDLYNYAINDVYYLDTTNDKKLSADEFENYYRDDWGITEDMANQIISHYDLDGDGYMDTLEFTKSLIDLDVNENGVWDDDEFMNFIDNGVSHVDLGGVTSDNLTQYLDLYNYAISEAYYMDVNNDMQISAEEYKVYLRDEGLPEYLADGLVSARFDLDRNNSIDVFELTKFYADIDINTSGALEFNELMSYYKELAAAAPGGYNFGFSPDISNSYQLDNAYSEQLSFVSSWDTNYDQKIQASEYQEMLDYYGYENASSMASNARRRFDANRDGGIDVFEWMDAILSFDSNNNGYLDADEETNFYNSL